MTNTFKVGAMLWDAGVDEMEMRRVIAGRMGPIFNLKYEMEKPQPKRIPTMEAAAATFWRWPEWEAANPYADPEGGKLVANVFGPGSHWI